MQAVARPIRPDGLGPLWDDTVKFYEDRNIAALGNLIGRDATLEQFRDDFLDFRARSVTLLGGQQNLAVATAIGQSFMNLLGYGAIDSCHVDVHMPRFHNGIEFGMRRCRACDDFYFAVDTFDHPVFVRGYANYYVFPKMYLSATKCPLFLAHNGLDFIWCNLNPDIPRDHEGVPLHGHVETTYTDFMSYNLNDEDSLSIAVPWLFFLHRSRYVFPARNMPRGDPLVDVSLRINSWVRSGVATR